MSRAKNRPVRKSQRLTGKLNFEERAGYVRRVVNSVDGRVQDFEADGWEVVRKPAEAGELQAGESTQLGSVVRKPVGGGIEGVLMEIPKEWYEEDQHQKELMRQSKESSLLSEAPELSGRDEISIKRGGRVTIE